MSQILSFLIFQVFCAWEDINSATKIRVSKFFGEFLGTYRLVELRKVKLRLNIINLKIYLKLH